MPVLTFYFFLNFLLFDGAEDKTRVLGMLASCALNLHFQPVCKASLLWKHLLQQISWSFDSKVEISAYLIVFLLLLQIKYGSYC